MPKKKIKTKEIKIRLSLSEKQKIKKLAHATGLSMSEYLLFNGLGQELKLQKTPTIEEVTNFFTQENNLRYKTNSNSKTEKITIKMSPEDKQKIREMADAVELPMTRYLLVKGLGEQLKPKTTPTAEEVTEFFTQFNNPYFSNNSNIAKASRVEARVSKEDKELLSKLAEAAGLSIGQYLITAGLGTPSPLRVKSEANEILREMKYWGNNLNQIAKGINEARKEGNLNLYEQTSRELSVIEQKLAEIKVKVLNIIA